MENIKKNTYNKSEYLFYKTRVYIFSLIGIFIFFIPMKFNNRFETLIYYMTYLIKDKYIILVNVSLIFFIALSILKEILNRENLLREKIVIVFKIFSLVVLIMILIKRDKVFFINEDLVLILEDLIFNLSILLPLSAIFLPLLIDFGLLEIVEVFTHKIMKRISKVSGRVFLNFLVYLLVGNVSGAFMTHILYKKGKLKEKEACITILNFSVLSLVLTKELCSSMNINLINFFIIEMISLIVCNSIVCRVYPLRKKKNSYYFKSEQKNATAKRKKLKKALKVYCENKSNKTFLQLSLSYLNEAILTLINIIPTIIIIFFVFNIFYNTYPVINTLKRIIAIFLEIFNLPNVPLMSNLISKNIFYNIFAIANINLKSYCIGKSLIGLFIALQCISIGFLIPFIEKSSIELSIMEIIFVIVERFIVICVISCIIYRFYIAFII